MEENEQKEGREGDRKTRRVREGEGEAKRGMGDRKEME